MDSNMETRGPTEFTLELSADRSSVKDIVKGILHLIFFHRYFPAIAPASHDILDVTLPRVQIAEIESLIDTKTTAFLRQLDNLSATQQISTNTNFKSSTTASTTKGHLVVQLLEKKRRKGWFVAKADEETAWENWIVEITLTSARSEAEASRNRRVMEKSLQKAAMKVVTLVNAERGHIPPITTTETNPFPFQVLVNPKSDGWGQKLGIF